VVYPHSCLLGVGSCVTFPDRISQPSWVCHLSPVPRHPGGNCAITIISVECTTWLPHPIRWVSGPSAALPPLPRYYRIAAFGHHSYSMREADVLYDCLPLYHSAGMGGEGRGPLRAALCREHHGRGAGGPSWSRPPQGTSWASGSVSSMD
jgi:hypothetical protein